MSFWIAQKSKLNKLNVGRCFCSDICTFLSYCLRLSVGKAAVTFWDPYRLLKENLWFVTLCWIY